MAKFMIHAAVLLDESAPQIAARINCARPEIDCRFGPDLSHPEEPYAILAFNPGEAINRYENAAWLHCTGAGIDKLLRALDFTPPLMTRTLGAMGAQLAEYVLAYVLEDSQRLRARRAAQAGMRWDRAAAEPAFLRGRRALFFGTGELAGEIAARLGAFGVVCEGVSRRGLPMAGFARTVPLERVGELAPAQADVIILALPNLPGMEGLVGSHILSQFEDALLINVGRGEVLDEAALLGALDAGCLRGAVLDVFNQEPLPPSSPLWVHPKITITPHIAARTRPEDAADAFLDALTALEAGRMPSHLIDPANYCGLLRS